MRMVVFFFQAEDGIRDIGVDWSSDVCSSDLVQTWISWSKWCFMLNINVFKTVVHEKVFKGFCYIIPW